MQLTPEQAEILLSADEVNLAAQVKKGKPLTLKQRARLESIRGGTPEPEAYVTTKADLARALNVTRQRLQFHTKSPDFPKPNDAGQYRTADVLAYARRAGLVPSIPSVPSSPTPSSPLDLYTERARLAKEQADRAAIENAKLRGELLEATAVFASWSLIASTVRQKVLALPPKIESQCNLPPDQRALLRKTLDREIDDLLTELSTPPDYTIAGVPGADGDRRGDPAQ